MLYKLCQITRIIQCTVEYSGDMVDLVCLEDYAAKGSEELRAFCKYYYNSGAGQETSLENNRDSFKR